MLESIANMFIFRGLEEALMVGSGGWYNGFLFLFYFILFFSLGEGLFCGLTWDSSLGGNGYVMAGRIPLVLKGL